MPPKTNSRSYQRNAASHCGKPSRSESYLILALLQRNNSARPGRDNFKKAVDVDPKSLSAQLMPWAASTMSRNRQPEAEAQFKHAIEVDPKNPRPAPHWHAS